MHEAIVIGCGRIGVGYGDGPKTSYVYTHADAYLALKDRVKLVGFVEPDPQRADWARKKYNVPAFIRMKTLVDELGADIISVCVQPEQQQAVLKQIPSNVKGVWCEKPFVCNADWPWPIQVNYIRRFDKGHYLPWIGQLPTGDDKHLFVVGKRDIHTVCHFVDLARWWGVKDLRWLEYDGPCSYTLRVGDSEQHFAFGGVVGGFMEHALSNLLDHIDNGTPLICPASEAVKTWKATLEWEARWKQEAR